MKPEKQRIAIAEACGAKWQIIRDFPSKVLCFSNPRDGLSVMRTELNDGRILAPDIPDYVNDLNAMHEAEETILKKGLQDIWLDNLVEVVAGKNIHWSDYHCFPQVNRATATQRAEAFLVTLNLWVDE